MDVIRSAWPAWLEHGFSTARGGVSKVYGTSSLNLGFTREDTAADVVLNRQRFIAAVAGSSEGRTLSTLRQVHSAVIHGLKWSTETTDSDQSAGLEGDGLVTNVPGVMLSIQTADCVPVLIADLRAGVVGAFHAGWRGTVSRIVERGVNKMVSEFGAQPGDMVAAIGPAIGVCCYGVGQEVVQQFEAEFPYAPMLFGQQVDCASTGLNKVSQHEPGARPEWSGSRVSLDLHAANRRQLIDAGIPAHQITVVAACTACSRTEDGQRRFFSYRGESGVTGRMLAVIGIRPEIQHAEG